MNNAQQTVRVGLFFILGLALIWVTFETLSGGRVFQDKGYELVAGFDNLKSLKPGDEVRMAGVKIGEVHKTQLSGSSRRAAQTWAITLISQVRCQSASLTSGPP